MYHSVYRSVCVLVTRLVHLVNLMCIWQMSTRFTRLITRLVYAKNLFLCTFPLLEVAKSLLLSTCNIKSFPLKTKWLRKFAKINCLYLQWPLPTKRKVNGSKPGHMEHFPLIFQIHMQPEKTMWIITTIFKTSFAWLEMNLKQWFTSDGEMHCMLDGYLGQRVVRKIYKLWCAALTELWKRLIVCVCRNRKVLIEILLACIANSTSCIPSLMQHWEKHSVSLFYFCF